MAQPRPRAVLGVDAGEPRARAARDEEAAVRLLPRQLGRGCAGREHPRLRRATRARSICSAATGTSSGGSAASRATSARRRRSSSRSSTTRGSTTATCSTLFDNGAIPKVEPYTRPLVLKLDAAEARRATIVEGVRPSAEALVAVRGEPRSCCPTAARSSAGAACRKVTEFTPVGDGAVRDEAAVRRHLPRLTASRGRARPAAKPAVGRRRLDASMRAGTASTDVVSWRVLAGDDADHLEQVGSAPWRGLETAIALSTPPRRSSRCARSTPTATSSVSPIRSTASAPGLEPQSLTRVRLESDQGAARRAPDPRSGRVRGGRDVEA